MWLHLFNVLKHHFFFIYFFHRSYFSVLNQFSIHFLSTFSSIFLLFSYLVVGCVSRFSATYRDSFQFCLRSLVWDVRYLAGWLLYFRSWFCPIGISLLLFSRSLSTLLELAFLVFAVCSLVSAPYIRMSLNAIVVIPDNMTCSCTYFSMTCSILLSSTDNLHRISQLSLILPFVWNFSYYISCRYYYY